MKSHCRLLLMVFLSVSMSAQENGKDAVVELLNMNVLYAGVSNPVQIAVPGVTSEEITATVTNGSINKTGSRWQIQPSTVSVPVVLTVFVNNQKVSEKTFRVKSIPVPHAALAGKINGAISKNEAIETGELDIELKDFLWDLKFEVRSYNFQYSENDKEISVNSNRLTDEIKSIISSLQPGQNITFKEIKVITPDNRIVEISPLTLSVN